MGTLQIWLLRRIFKRAFIQGPQHRDNLIHVYKLIRKAIDNEFTEDNSPSLDNFCLEAFNESQKILKGTHVIKTPEKFCSASVIG